METNIVIFDLSDETISAPKLVQKMEEQGFRIGAFGERRIRIVTHLDVDMDSATKLVAALKIYL